MAFTVESGSGDSDANAYVSVAFTVTYHTDRGNTAWDDFGTAEKQSAIIRASEYIDKRFGKRFVGLRKTKSQGLEWPRTDAFDGDQFLLSGVDDIPRNLEKATAEYALRAAICGVLAPDPILPVPKQDLTDSTGTRPDQGVTGEIIRTRDRLGPLEEERRYQPQSRTLAANLAAGARGVQSSLLNDFNIPEYPEADLWLEELLRSSMQMRLSRGD